MNPDRDPDEDAHYDDDAFSLFGANPFDDPPPPKPWVLQLTIY